MHRKVDNLQSDDLTDPVSGVGAFVLSGFLGSVVFTTHCVDLPDPLDVYRAYCMKKNKINSYYTHIIVFNYLPF